ncbi:MAG: DUF3109 family protein [Bacteroidota bacterium]
MILLDNTIVSEDVLERNFICNLTACKGACCVEGDFGAPITEEEIETLASEIENIKPFLTEAGIKAIAERGFWERDSDGDLVTTCLPTGECNFSLRDVNGILKCGIEEAHKNGKSSLYKPISCHLYPIRISQVGNYEALNYHSWDICAPACTLGKEHQVPVYQFLKNALTRKFGEAWYNELDEIAKQFKNNNP